MANAGTVSAGSCGGNGECLRYSCDQNGCVCVGICTCEHRLHERYCPSRTCGDGCQLRECKTCHKRHPGWFMHVGDVCELCEVRFRFMHRPGLGECSLCAAMGYHGPNSVAKLLCGRHSICKLHSARWCDPRFGCPTCEYEKNAEDAIRMKEMRTILPLQEPSSAVMYVSVVIGVCVGYILARTVSRIIARGRTST